MTANVPLSEFPIVIVGAGFAGLGMAIRLKQAGIDSFVVLEKADDVGGTWRDNRYPGCACDVPSHLYSYSFEPNPAWSRAYSPQPEIWNYLRACVEKYGLRPHIRFSCEMTGAEFDDSTGLWQVQTQRGERFIARALVLGLGNLSTPRYPDIAGLQNFQGKLFHSQQWDRGYDLRGKRVAVIGTGASAIQIVPRIQPLVARLDLYQRTPPWVLPRMDRAITPREHRLFRRFPLLQRLMRLRIYWAYEMRVIPFVFRPRGMKLIERVARRYLEAQVPDPELRRRLTPDYTIGCKRILLADDYYSAVQQPNVALITDAVREVRAGSIVDANGVEREVDALILATGFRATEPVARGVVRRRDGRDIWDEWQDGPEAYLGTAVAGFPNLFFLVGPNTGLGHSSMILMIESQVEYVLDALHALREQRLKSVEVRRDVQAAYNRALQGRLRGAVWSGGGCKSWYLDAHGKNVTLWPDFTWRFRKLTRHFTPDDYILCAQEPTTPHRRLERKIA